MRKEYYTVKNRTENLIVIERSKFICFIASVENEDEAKAFVDEIRKKHSLATHNCYAYIADEFGLVQKFSDDGEPQGTAGMPMLDVLKNRKLYKTVAVVTRYFGGVKLGTGGLVRAYSSSVNECLEKADVIKVETAVFIKVFTDYEGYSRLLKFLSTRSDEIIETDFSESVVLKLAVKGDKIIVDDFIVALNDYFCGNIKTQILNEGYYSFKV